MRKRWIVMMLSIALALNVSACGGNGSDDAEDSSAEDSLDGELDELDELLEELDEADSEDAEEELDKLLEQLDESDFEDEEEEEIIEEVPEEAADVIDASLEEYYIDSNKALHVTGSITNNGTAPVDAVLSFVIDEYEYDDYGDVVLMQSDMSWTMTSDCSDEKSTGYFIRGTTDWLKAGETREF